MSLGIAPQMNDLLRALDRWDHAWASKDYQAMQSVLAPDATLHADGILFEKDVKGADKIVDVHKRYFSNFDYEHKANARATNPETRAAFELWTDEGVHRREGESRASTICGMWKIIFNSDCSAATDIYFLRQLHAEEAEHRLRDPSAIARGGAEGHRFQVSYKEAPQERCAAARKAAERYSEIWETGNADIADEIMEEDVRSLDLMHGCEMKGRDAFTNMIKEMQTGQNPEESSVNVDIGVSADGSVAMIHWRSAGKLQGKEEKMEMYGLSTLVINEQGKIKETAGFSQFMPEERARVMKPDAFAREH